MAVCFESHDDTKGPQVSNMTQLSPLQFQKEEVLINGTECYVDAEFLDINGIAYTPSSLQYRIDDLTNGVPVLPWTTVVPSQAVTITIPTTVNTMNVLSKLRERRQFLLQVGIPGGTFQNVDTTYALVRRVGTP